MRVVAGALKNRRLKAPLGFGVRPTSEKIREALFNILGAKIEGCRFLDLCAGSGAVGIEAASRGAMHVTFVENRKSAIKALQSNIMSLSIHEMTTIIHFDVLDTIKTLNNRQRTFDILFADPPYQGSLINDIINMLAKYPVMKKESVIITQTFFKTSLTLPLSITQTRLEKYGESHLTFLSWNVSH